MPKPCVLFLAAPQHGFELVLASGTAIKYPVHTHVSTYTVGLVRKGRIRLRRGGKQETIASGGFFRIPPHEPHSLASDHPYAMLTLCLDVRFATESSPGERPAQLGRTLDRLVRRGILTRPDAARLKKMAAEIPAGEVRTESRDGLWQLEQCLEHHPETPMPLADMAAIAHVGKYHLIRKFKRRYGLTPGRFLVQSRIRKARQAIPVAASLTQAALAAGFFDQSHCIREFRRLHGLTPRQYRAAFACVNTTRA